MGIKIVIDSASDYSFEEAKKEGLVFLPLTVTFGEKEYRDSIDISNEEFYNMLEKSDALPKTSQVTPYHYEQEFEKIVENGDFAIAITVSSKLSGTYSSATIAAQKYPGKVFVVDSLNGSIGEKILIQYAKKLTETMDDPEKIVELLNEQREKIAIYYLVDTLEYLQKGGRVSKFASMAGSLLSVKPILTFENYEIAVAGKARGFKKGHNLLQEIVADRGKINSEMPFIISYSGNDRSTLDKYVEKYEEIFNTDLSSIPVTKIGSTIGTHLGPNSIGIAYFTE